MADVLIVDSYDSFTFNLVHAVEAILDRDVDVYRPHSVTPHQLDSYTQIIFSPGAGLPSEVPNLLTLVEAAMAAEKKILGVCLGHQALAVAGGAGLKNLDRVHHGVSHEIKRTEAASRLFKDFNTPFMAGRYHSWVVDYNALPDEWVISLRDQAGEIMGMEHREKPFYGIQFHPESVLTPNGRAVIRAFLDL